MSKDKKCTRFVCIHGHFYQPPRENPWLEAIEVEDSAAPYHNWNARINAECYAANAVARLLDSRGHIEAVINTYESLSFNFGPTLLSWLEEADPQTYEAIIEADRKSLESRSGHGNAMAQAFNHLILPLASRRDKETQVRWGICDFATRFGRQPEGLWLPETAVDRLTLKVLAEQGIRFAVLAPHQAAAVRPIGASESDWETLDGNVDTTQAYLCELGDELSMSLFFYDDPVSRAVAFEGLLGDGSALTQRLLSRFDESEDRPQLVHIATDGESYGHHHKYGDMALAYAFHKLADEPDVQVTNYGEFLDLAPPTMEARIADETSWSCSHGVGRWSEDCGCRVAGGSQAWRGPLRKSLDWLRDEIDRLYEEHTGALLSDPWEARNRYVEVLLDRRPERVDRFLDDLSVRRLEHFDRVDALSLLEMERNRMLMFTSCGWFFDDCAGIETVQILKYASRAIQLASRFGEGRLEQHFIERLEALESNDEEAQNGRRIYERSVRPSMVDLRRVVSHHAITKMFDPVPAEERQLYCFQLRDLDWNYNSSGGTRLAVGRVRVQSYITRAIEDVSFGLLHFGGHDFNCSLRGAVSIEGYDVMRDTLVQTFQSRSLTDVVHAFDRYFEGHHFGLSDLFLEGRRAVLKTVTSDVLAEMETAFESFYDDHIKLFDYLCDARFPLPEAFKRTIEFALERRVLNALERLEAEAKTPESALKRLDELSHEVDRRSVELGRETLGPPLSAALEALAEQLLPSWPKHTLSGMRRILKISRSFGIEPSLWDVQNVVINSLEQRPPRAKDSRNELEAALEELGITPPPRPRRRRATKRSR